MNHKISHKEQITRLKKIEGQIRGIIRMVEEQRYCIHIITQMNAAIAALHKAKELILRRHLESCVADAMRSGSEMEKTHKLDEVMGVLSQFKK